MKTFLNAMEASCPGAAPARPAEMPHSLVLLFAAASGLSVANVYYAQPLLDALAFDMGISHAAVGGVVTATQIGCALALVFWWATRRYMSVIASPS